MRAAARAKLRKGLHDMLALYPQPLARTEERLASLSGPDGEASAEDADDAVRVRRWRQALVVVLGEQRILTEAISALDADEPPPLKYEPHVSRGTG